MDSGVAQQIKKVSKLFGVKNYNTLAALSNELGYSTSSGKPFTYQTVRKYMAPRNKTTSKRKKIAQPTSYEKFVADESVPMQKRLRVAKIMLKKE